MLKLIFGRAGYGKTYYVKENAIKKALEGKKTFILLPDQYTYKMENDILNLAGPKTANLINIYSLSRLSEDILSCYGGGALKRIDETGKKLIMFKAIEELSDELTVYGKDPVKQADEMLLMVETFKTSGVSPDKISEASGNTESKELSDKLRELSLIYSVYDALINEKYTDPSDVVALATDKVKGTDYFTDSVVFIDAFESFSKQKLGLITEIIKTASEVYVTICADNENEKEMSAMAIASKTARQLISVAEENNVNIENKLKLSFPYKYTNDELAFLEKNIFSDTEEMFTDNTENITIFEAEDKYTEVNYVAASLRNLILSGNYEYSDFVVAVKDTNKYTVPLEAAFRKYEIPCYFSKPHRVDSSPLIRLVLLAFKDALFGYNTEDILNILKTGPFTVSDEEIIELENYVFTWKINGYAWDKAFIKHPDGYGKKVTEESEEKLKRINEVKDKIINPIKTFKEKIHKQNGQAIGKAVYELLEAYGTADKIREASLFFSENNMTEQAENGVRVWTKLMNVLDQFAMSFKDEVIDEKKYYQYLTNVLSVTETRDVPDTFDSVTFGSPESVMQSEAKVMFILDAEKGVFPSEPSETGLISESEREELKSLDVYLENSLDDMTTLEKFNAYRALACPSEKLFITYHKSEGKNQLEKSEVIEEIITYLFNDVSVVTNKDLPEDFYLTTKNAVFSKYSSIYAEKSEMNETLKSFFSNNNEFEGKLKAVNRVTDTGNFEIEDKSLSNRLLSNGEISASQIDTYFHCKFRFFCNYTLKVRERKPAEINAIEYGTIMHYIFENVIKNINNYSENRTSLNDDIALLINDYANENLGGLDNMTPREKYRLRRLIDAAVYLCGRMLDELEHSKFIPSEFELNLNSSDNEYEPLSIITETGKTLKVGGTIDRVDLCEIDGKKYVRVVDYKTGKKEFKLLDVLYGLNLQMLVYLAALVQDGKLNPAGVLYMPSYIKNIKIDDKNADENVIIKEVDKKQHMNGYILDDIAVLNAMEEGLQGRFIPVSMGKKELKGKTSLYSEATIDIVFKYIKGTITRMANEILSGEISPMPNMKNTNSCSICPYAAVCLSKKKDAEKEKVKFDNEEIIAQMGGEENATVD